MREIRSGSRHRRTDKKSTYKLLFGILFIVIIMIIFWVNLKEYQAEEEKIILDDKFYLPEANLGTVYHKPYFSLSYVEQFEIPEWVAYRLTEGMLNKKKFPREQDFQPDPEISEGSAHYRDYKQSGFRRGHLVPSADMSWDKKAMDATFLLSNIAPMSEAFNDGIWLELEHNVRDWARQFGDIFVVAGPVFTDPVSTIGKNEVLVPRYYYKAIFRVQDQKPEVISFLLDQMNASDHTLEEFIVPVDSIEKLTGLDLFSNMYGSWDAEIELEAQQTKSKRKWPFNEQWYLQRIE